MYRIIPFSKQYQTETVAFILAILEDEFGHTGIQRPDLQDISQSYQQDPQANFWIALDDGKVVGTVGLQNCDLNRSRLKRMLVQKELRHQGIGQQLLDTVIGFCKEVGHKELYAISSVTFEIAHKFYQKNNFQLIPELPEGITDDHDTIYFKLVL